MENRKWVRSLYVILALICFNYRFLECKEIFMIIGYSDERMIYQISKMAIKPDWYNLLREDFKTIDDNRINILENTRIKYGVAHDYMAFAIVSTSWACERAQYSALNELKKIYAGHNYSDKSLWKEVLMGRLNLMENVRDIEPNNKALQRIIRIVPILKSNIDTILSSINNIEDEVRYVLCLEKEAGNLDDPGGGLEEINRILGGRIPSSNDMNWFKNINNKFMKW